jgi:hypothetical protein
LSYREEYERMSSSSDQHSRERLSYFERMLKERESEVSVLQLKVKELEEENYRMET